MRKLYVLDTSVLIHDPECIKNFTSNDVALPIFVIIELDDLKERKKTNVSFKSREASRNIQDIQGDGDLQKGVYLEQEDINVSVIGCTTDIGIKALQSTTNPRKMDLWIMECALEMQKQYDQVVLVSKDLNLRLLCQGQGLIAEDYETDKVDVADLYPGYTHLGECPLLKEAYNPNAKIQPIELVPEPMKNQFYVSQWGDKSIVCRNVYGEVLPVDKEFGVGVNPRNLEQRMALDLLTDPTVKLITLVGKAGTGKTFLTLASALSQLHSQYEQVILAKPIIDMGNSIGFLPGDLDEKLQPWMASYYDNLSKIMPSKSVVGNGKKKEPHWKYLLDTEAIVVQPLNSIRGRSLDNAFIVIDEAQNLTTHEIKTIITRAGENAKVVLLGDPYQVDSPFLDKHSNGLTYVTQRMLGEHIFGTVFFTQGVRSELAEIAANRL